MEVGMGMLIMATWAPCGSQSSTRFHPITTYINRGESKLQIESIHTSRFAPDLQILAPQNCSTKNTLDPVSNQQSSNLFSGPFWGGRKNHNRRMVLFWHFSLHLLRNSLAVMEKEDPTPLGDHPPCLLSKMGGPVVGGVVVLMVGSPRPSQNSGGLQDEFELRFITCDLFDLMKFIILAIFCND